MTTPPIQIGDLVAAMDNAEAFANAGDMVAARARCEAVLEQDPDMPRALELLAWLAFRAQEFDDAIRLLEKGIAAARQRLGAALKPPHGGTPDRQGIAILLSLLCGMELTLGWCFGAVGRSIEAEYCFGRADAANRRRNSLAAPRPAGDPVRLASDMAAHVGETGSQLDTYVKLVKLGFLPDRRGVVPTTVGSIANRAYLDLWRPHVTLAEDYQGDAARLQAFNPLVPLVRKGRGFHTSVAWSIAQQAWEAQDRPPLLTLPPEMLRRGRAFLKSCLGFGAADWFVALHMRDRGYGDRTGRSEDDQQHRNQSLAPVVQALSEITDRGGWVIRLGHPQAPRLPDCPKVFDYAHFARRAPWLDLFFCAACRFFWGTASGPFSMAATFGVPVAAMNWTPMSMPPPSRDHLFVGKTLRYRPDSPHGSRKLTLREALADPLRHAQRWQQYEDAGVEVVENDGRTLRRLLIERFETLHTTPASSDMQHAAEKAYHDAGLVLNSKLSAANALEVD